MKIIGELPEKEYLTLDSINDGEFFRFWDNNSLYLRIDDDYVFDVRNNLLRETTTEDAYIIPVDRVKVELTIIND